MLFFSWRWLLTLGSVGCMHTHTLSMANFAFQVQSEVVRLSERLEKMERIALERQEKERERERARERSERERQLSARVRQLEGPSICRDVNGLAWLRRPAPLLSTLMHMCWHLC